MRRPAAGVVALSVTVLGAALVVALLGWLDPVHAVLLAAVVLVVTAVWRRADAGVEDPWPAPPEEQRPGARHDVSELGWATFTRSGEVSERVLRRVRALAAARLARHGVDLADPAQASDVERLLGEDVARGLASRRAPTARVLDHWLGALERLGPDGPPRADRPSPPPTGGAPR
ncbi:hypothetical protein [Isoptericola variabilis]|uniref:Uncharacterized protein n=1 Tax=Isoptericola variabilis (strain 225) TaxID=743718 RepID=F6FUV3_ISOV2|nr:hypothetical protein [Isoptericola variabilis]AEG44293.1 hypothetical protein Isova_1539 [Isoptericola variabilis 225]